MKTAKQSFMIFTCVLLLGAWKSPTYDIGDVVSDFTLKNFDGKMVSLSDYDDAKGVILIFDCNTCPYSRIYNTRIIALNAKYANKGFPVVTVNPNHPELSPGDSFQEMVAQAKKKKYTFPYLYDESQQVARSFGASNTPHVFILKNENDKFKVAYTGTIDNNSGNPAAVTQNYVEQAVDALIDEKAIPTTRTKAIGCGIKWKR